MKTEVSWQPAGRVLICEKGWPKFPKVPKLPGLYRITLKNGRCYIGETRNLSRRLYEYRRPTKGVECEHRLHQAIIKNDGASLEIFATGDPSLSEDAVRRRLEGVAIKKALDDGVRLLNDDGPNDPDRLREKIAYHQNEIDIAQSKLNKIDKEQGVS
ncbi:MAG: GIY-YIG nuclease family protein [Bdellovibrionales bacterium]